MQNPVQALRSCEQRGPCNREERLGRLPKIRAEKIHYKNFLRLLEISELEPPPIGIVLFLAIKKLLAILKNLSKFSKYPIKYSCKIPRQKRWID
ncbi:hypothetical protein CROQUDRAFT_96921 [Cronartium quercuum f. sp. fusiforme G11]|uniref:Uncharacterized protein n=1 Tax=Cronartium quercuum f. sp. fusiforme G11 TaxID=708437 RepID=A0A9P6NBL6_9BASI|nr:hypothetical protein CROQUDRAFT_96921 [Cronartium quercuum f. sp. fusiforme G11]